MSWSLSLRGFGFSPNVSRSKTPLLAENKSAAHEPSQGFPLQVEILQHLARTVNSLGQVSLLDGNFQIGLVQALGLYPEYRMPSLLLQGRDALLNAGEVQSLLRGKANRFYKAIGEKRAEPSFEGFLPPEPPKRRKQALGSRSGRF